MIHFVFLFIFSKRLRSLKINLDLIITLKPKPYFSIHSKTFLTYGSCDSICIYGSLIKPVPIIVFYVSFSIIILTVQLHYFSFLYLQIDDSFDSTYL